MIGHSIAEGFCFVKRNYTGWSMHLKDPNNEMARHGYAALRFTLAMRRVRNFWQCEKYTCIETRSTFR